MNDEKRGLTPSPANDFETESIEGGCRIVKYIGENKMMSKSQRKKKKREGFGNIAIVIPETINGEPIREIAGDAFADCKNVEGIYIPESLIEKDGIILNCNDLIDVGKPNGRSGVRGYWYRVYFLTP